ncbi:unnamed protein product [Cylicocyclus nassatus]|uniref:Cell division protein FtsX n=1 Tax=Cylicocyclus nassatus TaxID=53992 RepID=A0AA36GQH7_CYLNA|nr:unnamed protein product [Cylicocyclus nassatus]
MVMALALALPLGLSIALDNLKQFAGSVQAELRDAGLGEAIDALNDNPLPSLLVITPGQGKDDARLARALESLPEADLVQHDALWRQRLDAWLAFGARLVQVLSVLLGAGAALVVGNTLLGASDGFIRRPFLYLGAWYGLGAGAVALALIAAAGAALRMPLAELSRSYGSPFVLHGLDLLHGGLVLLGTLLLGWLGAWLVTGHFLRQTRPTDT